MGPHAMPVGIKTWGQDDIMFKSTKIFHLFDKISGNSGRHFLQPSQPIDFQSILIYDYSAFSLKMYIHKKKIFLQEITLAGLFKQFSDVRN